MKFAHLADCHVGGWREDKLKELSIKAFEEAVNICIKENTAFVLISGDLFNTSLPNLDIIKRTAEALDRLRQNDISCYIIPGSHDFSPSGKTMLDVLEKAGLMENVMKFNNNKLEFTLDKTNTKITGIFGLRQGLDRKYYENLDKESLAKEQGFKIFMFHATLDEFKPKDQELVFGQSYQDLPKNFNYYAGGHTHIVFNEFKDGYGLIAYPGPLFPNSFKELEELKAGGFYILDEKLNLRREEIKLKDVESFFIDSNNKTPEEIEKELKNIKNTEDKIVLIRIEGVLKTGKPSEIDFKEIFDSYKAYIVLKNTNKLKSLEFEGYETKHGDIEEVESIIIKENLSKINTVFNQEEIAKQLMHSLNLEKDEGERNIDFDMRLTRDIMNIFDLENVD
ncbi:MAG: Metallophosphoesterase [archaeon GW2011_AR20]|nr:MAG: Metallophosphoesterase [archaeon GW2011_AR20]MBS3160836.1 DNA repair exonuclease [Candidatus Woesearchaeota archaeon]